MIEPFSTDSAYSKSTRRYAAAREAEHDFTDRPYAADPVEDDAISAAYRDFHRFDAIGVPSNVRVGR